MENKFIINLAKVLGVGTVDLFFMFQETKVKFDIYKRNLWTHSTEIVIFIF